MTLTAFLDGSDIGTTRVRLGDFGLSTRADGTGAFGSIVFDDPDGTMTVRGWMPIYLEDDECEAAPRLFTGWIWDRTYRRGPYRHGAGREIECQLVDTNALLSLRLITNPDGKRPAETHNERINWLLASAYLTGLVVDNGLVNDTNPRPFGEADYRPQYPNDVLNDIAGPIFRTYFTYWDQEQEEVALFFDIPVATTFTSDLTISNVLSDTGDIDDPDTECFPPMIDAELARSPSEVYALIYYRYAKGVVIEKNVDTFNEFFPDLGYRGLAVENSRIGSEESARIMAQTLLTRYSGEADTVTVTVRLPPSKAGLIDAGQRIAVRFTHLPGYEDEEFVYTRVTARTIKQSMITDRDGTRRYYDLLLELNTHGLTSIGGGPPPTDFPNPPAPLPTIVQHKADEVDASGNITLDEDATPGNTLVTFVTSRSAGITLPDGWTEHTAGQITPGSDAARMAYRRVNSADASEIQVTTSVGDWAEVWEIAGLPDVSDEGSENHDTLLQPATVGAGSVTVATGDLVLAGICVHCSDWGGNGDTTIGSDDDFTTDDKREVVNTGNTAHPLTWAGHLAATSPATVGTSLALTGAAFNFAGWGGLTMAFRSTGSSQTPAPAQEFGPITPIPAPDGVRTTFMLPDGYAFADGSLKVFVNRLDQTAAVTSYDGSCGLFTLAFAPWGTDVIEVYGQGR